MASTSRVVVVRMRDGGVLMLAPASVMPWPLVIDRSLRRLQEEGLQRALADPSARSRLFAEAPGLLGDVIARGAVRGGAPALVQALLTAARQDRLTVIYGHGEPALRGGRPKELPRLYEAHGVVGPQVTAVRSPRGDPSKSLPHPRDPLPPTIGDRLSWICARVPKHLSSDVELPMREFFGPATVATTVALLKLWAEAGAVGIGFAVDAAVFGTAVSELGRDAIRAFDDLHDAFELAQDATSWNALEQSAQKLASAVSILKASVFRQLLRRIGGRTGSMAKTDGGGGGAHRPLAVGAVVKRGRPEGASTGG